jgi:hypothetical protein
MKVWAKKGAKFFGVYFLIFFMIFRYLLYDVFRSGPLLARIGNKRATVKKVSALCQNVERVTSSGDSITVHYSKLVPTNNETIISHHFPMATSFLGQQIFFPPGSANVTVAEQSLTLQFFLPVIDEFSCTLFCAVPGSKEVTNMETLEPLIMERFQLSMKVEEWGNTSEFSRLRCHHKELFQRRWCEFRNMAFFENHFFFFSPAIFSFPEPFLVPGPRSPPFDKTQDQFVIEPIVIRFGASTVPRQLTYEDKFCYIYGVFHNYYMLWHTAFDFMIPLHNFMRMLNTGDTPETRRVYVRSDGVWAFHCLMKIFSTVPVEIIDETNPSIIMRRGVIGIEKLERDVSLSRTYDDSIGFNYDFNRSHALGMRETVLEQLGWPNDAVCLESGKPLVMLIDRQAHSRNIENTQEIFDLMSRGCPHCEVRLVRFENMRVEDQVKMVSRASVLVGLHGSGLTHVLWMAESRPNHTTHLIELMPYKYLCRPWYQTAADVAGVNYHMVMNKKRPKTTRPGIERCWDDRSICATLGCHDLLRDQTTSVELETFSETWDKIAKALKSTVCVDVPVQTKKMKLAGPNLGNGD